MVRWCNRISTMSNRGNYEGTGEIGGRRFRSIFFSIPMPKSINPKTEETKSMPWISCKERSSQTNQLND